MSQGLEVVTRRTVGVRDIPLVLVAPRRLFARVEDVTAWGWPLLILLTLVTLIGYAIVQTGLIDREIQMGISARKAQIEQTQRDVVERSALRDLYENEDKQGEFDLLLTRIKVVAAEPLKALAAALLIAATLYGVVALSGRKPEWHTLLTVCVYAGFIDALRLLVTLGLMLHYRTLDVDTSLALLVPLWTASHRVSPTQAAVASGLLPALDPFRVWYWWVVIVALRTTAQLRGWRAWITCGLCWLAAAGVRCGVELGAAQMSGGAGPSSA